MRSDGFWAKVIQVGRPGPPLFRITASPWWTEVLVAAGAQRARTADTMTVKFSEDRQDLPTPLPVRVGYDVVPDNVMRPREYSDLRSVAERFRNGNRVLLDLTGWSDADARRGVDFAAGLALGLKGSLEKVENKLFLLTPEKRKDVDRPKFLINEVTPSGLKPLSPDDKPKFRKTRDVRRDS